MSGESVTSPSHLDERPAPLGEDTARRSRLRWGAAVIFLLVLAVYWPALRGDFVWDDALLVQCAWPQLPGFPNSKIPFPCHSFCSASTFTCDSRKLRRVLRVEYQKPNQQFATHADDSTSFRSARSSSPCSARPQQ